MYTKILRNGYCLARTEQLESIQLKIIGFSACVTDRFRSQHIYPNATSAQINYMYKLYIKNENFCERNAENCTKNCANFTSGSEQHFVTRKVILN